VYYLIDTSLAPALFGYKVTVCDITDKVDL